MAKSTTVATAERAVLHGAGTTIISVVVTCVADPSDGSFADGTISDVGGLYLGCDVVYGTTAPTDGATDISLTPTGGVNLLGASGTNITTTADQHLTPQNSAADVVYKPFKGPLTQSITGNSVNDAEMTITHYFAP